MYLYSLFKSDVKEKSSTKHETSGQDDSKECPDAVKAEKGNEKRLSAAAVLLDGCLF